MNTNSGEQQTSSEIFQGFYIFGALALAGLMLAGTAFNNKSVVVLAIGAAGLGYLAQLAASAHLNTGSDTSRNLNLSFTCLAIALFISGLAKLAVS